MQRNYKQLCYEPFAKGCAYFPLLVHTGKNDDECRPMFKTVLAETPVKLNAGGKILWGISCFDAETGESQWYGYNDGSRLASAICRNRYDRASRVREPDGAYGMVAYPALVCQQPAYYTERAGMSEGGR